MNNRVMDISTLLGIVIAVLLVAVAIYVGGDGSVAGILGFFDIKSVLIVVFGTLLLTAASFTVSEIWQAKSPVTRTLLYRPANPTKASFTALELAEIARKKGVLELQKHDNLMKDHPFLRKGLEMIIDGMNPGKVSHIMEREMAATLDTDRKTVSIIRKAAEISPAMGLIGTLVGLVQMLGSLNDPASIGPAMAVALLTTFYGAVLSFMIFTPLASKLDRNIASDSILLQIYFYTIMSVGKKENPRQLEMMINALLPPAQRVRYFN